MFKGTLQNPNCTINRGIDEFYEHVNRLQGIDSLDRTIWIIRIHVERRGSVLNRINTFNRLIEGSFLLHPLQLVGPSSYTFLPLRTFVISSTITTSCLSP